MKNVLIMSDSLSGTGHQKRAEVLCAGLVDRGCRITYFSNQLHNTRLDNLDTFYFLELPSYSKIPKGAESFISQKFERMRKIIEHGQTADHFDVIIFEHFPIGKYYLLDEMKLIQRFYKQAGTACICVYRDVIDNQDMEEVGEGIKILNNFFDALIVLSDEKHMPLPESFTSKVKIPITYLGYLATRQRDMILVFGGGGKFNYEFYQLTLAVLSKLHALEKFNIVFYTGNLMGEAEFSRLRKHTPEHIKICRYSGDLYREQLRSFITISTLGYNTFLDLLPLNNYNVVVPLTRNDEQLIRARLFERIKSNVAVIVLNQAYSKNLELALENILDSHINTGGLANFLDYVDSIFSPEITALQKDGSV